MTPRQRVLAALSWTAPDVVPLRIFPAPGGLYEHGRKLADLIRECGHDFGPLDHVELPPPPPPEDFDPDGSYHAFKTDAWGTTWEYRIFGIWGHPVKWPLDDWSKLDAYRAPAPPPCAGDHLEAARAQAAAHRQRYYLLHGGGSLFEKLHSVRRFEDVLMDILHDAPEVNRLTDLIADNVEAHVRRALALGADGVTFGDDFGTQTALLLSPDTWRRFFKPRYQVLFEPVKAAGKHVLFHSCGKIGPILEDLREIGVDVIWPQLTAFDLPELAAQCRDLGLTVELHPDRGELMQRSRPAAIKDYVHRVLDAFGTLDGGSWLYLEVDPGFPWDNVEALFEVAMELRTG